VVLEHDPQVLVENALIPHCLSEVPTRSNRIHVARTLAKELLHSLLMYCVLSLLLLASRITAEDRHDGGKPQWRTLGESLWMSLC
jgi:hypothetical protein